MPILYQKQEKRNGSLAGKKQTSGSSTEPIYGGTQTVYGLKTTAESSESKRNSEGRFSQPRNASEQNKRSFQSPN